MHTLLLTCILSPNYNDFLATSLFNKFKIFSYTGMNGSRHIGMIFVFYGRNNTNGGYQIGGMNLRLLPLFLLRHRLLYGCHGCSKSVLTEVLPPPTLPHPIIHPLQHSCYTVNMMVFKNVDFSFLHQAHGLQLCAPGFLTLFWFVRWYVCVSAPRPLITSGMI